MNTPLDQNINKFFKGFVTSPQGGYEDPTYLGFRLVFDFDPVTRNLETGQTDDPLFSENDSLESAIRYLKATGYPNRAIMLQEFKANLKYINNETPWYWQSIAGLNDIWKIEFGEAYNPLRAKDKFLEIECLESIDLRVTALADLYRKATFDTKFMRSLVPENLRWFTLRVQISEMRSFHRVKQMVNSVNTTVNQSNSNLKNTNSASNTPTATGTLSTHANELEPINDLISLLEFELSHCTFDFWDSFPNDNLISDAGSLDAAKQKFKIKVGHIQEQHSYKLLELILKDGVTQENGEFNKNVPNFDQAINKRSDNILTNTVQGLTSNLQDKLNRVASVPGNLIAGGVNTVGSKITSVSLGNVYDVRNQSLGTVVNGFLGKNEQIAPTVFEDVYPNVPGTDLTTPDAGPMGNIYT